MSRAIAVKTGDKYGRLTIIREVESYRDKKGKLHRRIECKCECGNIRVFDLHRVRYGKAISCGCYNKEAISNQSRCHHLSKNNRIYRIWLKMKNRCYNKNNEHYHLYGGRDIKVCKEWRESYLAFHEWAINNGYNDSLSIDRIDFNRDYEPNNCRWANQKTQTRNKSTTLYILVNDIKMPVIGFCEIFGLDYNYVTKVLKKMRYKYVDFISMKEREEVKP